MPCTYMGKEYDPVLGKKFYNLTEKYFKYYFNRGVGGFKARHIAEKKAMRDLRIPRLP